jgi:hypothetical protein
MPTPTNSTWHDLDRAEAELRKVWRKREAVRLALLAELVREREYTGGWFRSRSSTLTSVNLTLQVAADKATTSASNQPARGGIGGNEQAETQVFSL